MSVRKKVYGKPLKEEYGGYKVKPELKSDGNPSGKFAVVTGRKKTHAHGLTVDDALTRARNLSLGLTKDGKKIKKK